MPERLMPTLQWAHEAETFADPHDYRAGYRALCGLFRDYVQVDQFDSCLSGALAVYGWMPTILKRAPRNAWSIHQQSLASLRAATAWKDARQVIAEDEKVLRLFNNSSVGTSKFLHFLNPQVLPIWDSYIERVLGRLSYVEYGDLLHAAITRQAAEGDWAFPRTYQTFAGVSTPLRQWEHLAFLHGQALKTGTRLPAMGGQTAVRR